MRLIRSKPHCQLSLNSADVCSPLIVLFSPSQFSDIPEVMVKTREIDINETQSAVLTCTATGVPLPR